MANNKKCVAQIPARAGSKRLENKNLRLLCGKPMIQYSIEAALVSKVDEVFVNSDSEEILCLAETLGAKPFRRVPELAGDKVTQDQFNEDFFQKVDCEAMVLVNPVCPMTNREMIDSFLSFARDGQYETCLTTVCQRSHAFYEGRALNFDLDAQLPPTQTISPLEIISWNLCYWNKASYQENMAKYGSASTRGKLGRFSVRAIDAVKISYKDDFEFAEALMTARLINGLQ